MTFDLKILQTRHSFVINKTRPQLHIFDSESHDKLRMNVWTVFYHLLIFLNLMEYTAAKETDKPRVGRYWWEVGKIASLKKLIQHCIVIHCYIKVSKCTSLSSPPPSSSSQQVSLHCAFKSWDLWM